MLRNIKALLSSYRTVNRSPLDNLPYLRLIYCENAINALLPCANRNAVLCPPFFRASTIPVAPKRVQNAIFMYSPIMLFNALKFEGCPKNESLLKISAVFNQELRDAEKTNPWVEQLLAAASSGVRPGDHISSLSQDEKIELNLSRPMYDELIQESTNAIFGWFLSHWESQKEWALGIKEMS